VSILHAVTGGKEGKKVSKVRKGRKRSGKCHVPPAPVLVVRESVCNVRGVPCKPEVGRCENTGSKAALVEGYEVAVSRQVQFFCSKQERAGDDARREDGREQAESRATDAGEDASDLEGEESQSTDRNWRKGQRTT
jgi:hypothetical protein